MQTSTFTRFRRWRHLQQSLLGSSLQGELCIVLRSSHIEQPIKCFISALPDELLTQILDFVSPPKRGYNDGEYQKSLRYLRVCRRWRRVYESILYRFPDLGSLDSSTFRLPSILLRTLEQRPDLGICVSKFEFKFSGFYRRTSVYPTLAELLHSCHSSVRHVKVHAHWEDAAFWNVIHCLQVCGRLHTLHISSISTHPRVACGLKTILEQCDIPSLRTLTIDRYGICPAENPSASTRACYHRILDLLVDGLSNLLRGRRGKGAMTTLRVRVPSIPVHITDQLVQWPARLVSFSLTILGRTVFFRQYTAVWAQQMLDYHRESLENVELGMLSRSDRSPLLMPDFSQFPKLRTLQLFSYNLLAEEPLVAAAKLIGGTSTLKHLQICFEREDEPWGATEGFGPTQLQWFQAFLTAPITMTESISPDDRLFHSLDTIHIRFEPDVDITSDLQDDSQPLPAKNDVPPWPWRHVDQAASAASKLGVKMKYAAKFTRREWFRMWKREWRRERRWRAKERTAVTMYSCRSGQIGTPSPSSSQRDIGMYFETEGS